jgi:hypothetical protein
MELIHWIDYFFSQPQDRHLLFSVFKGMHCGFNTLTDTRLHHCIPQRSFQKPSGSGLYI